MNIENLLKEIHDEKEKISSKVELKETNFLESYYKKDVIFFMPLLMPLTLEITLYINNNILFLITAFLCGVVPFLLFLSFFKTKNISLSYYFRSVFKKEKLKKNIVSDKNKIVSRKEININFLRKIALNMEKIEFKDFLKECDGDITFEKLEDFICPNDEKRKKANNIEELTTVIYEENKNLTKVIYAENKKANK